MKLFRLLLPATTLLHTLIVADWQYRSQPDLSPPKLNITVPATSSEKGYLFIVPYPGHKGEGPVQPGAYIFRDNGDLVWSGVGYFAGWVAYFRTGILEERVGSLCILGGARRFPRENVWQSCHFEQ